MATRNILQGQQTPGKFSFHYERERWMIEGRDGTPGSFAVAVGAGKHPTHAANAALYAEAHNVANETGMWPQQMVERIRELEQLVSTQASEPLTR
jgi:hypothetical protein